MSKPLELKQLHGTKICSDSCKHVYDNGLVEKMGAQHVVYCVGCGKGCHMPCHNVPEPIANSIKNIPVHNRAKAYFGEMSYVKIVCDNCANLLTSEVPIGEKPTFFTLFNKLATKLIEKFGEGSEMKMDEEGNSNENGIDDYQSGKKRKGVAINSTQDMLCEMIELKRLVNSCFIKMKNVETTNEQILEASKASTVAVEKLNTVEGSITNVLNRLNENGTLLSTLHTKIDGNALVMDDGFQKGFNKLADLNEKMCSPSTPVNNDRWFTPNGYNRGTSLRRMAFTNRSRHRGGTPFESSGGPVIPTENGAATDNGLFGPAVPRRLNFEGQHAEGAPRKEFRHENAIYIRYVDASIKPETMVQILAKKEEVKRMIEQTPDSIEVTRLVKKTMSEEDIAKRRFGVSYRIGCCLELIEVIKDKSMWANHWEIREWDKDYGKRNQTEQRSNNANFRNQHGQEQMET